MIDRWKTDLLFFYKLVSGERRISTNKSWYSSTIVRVNLRVMLISYKWGISKRAQCESSERKFACSNPTRLLRNKQAFSLKSLVVFECFHVIKIRFDSKSET